MWKGKLITKTGKAFYIKIESPDWDVQTTKSGIMFTLLDKDGKEGTNLIWIKPDNIDYIVFFEK